MKRKILSLILVFAMTVSLLTVGTGAVEPTYGDTAGHWAESSIERWSGHGIIQGSNGLFDPNGQLTCAQLATILAKLLKLPAAKDAGFTDNTADAWYYDAINRCAAAGILNGNGDGTVTPEAPISRERAMVMLARALGIEPIRKPDLTKYTDAAQVSAYAQGYVAALIEAGIVGGVTADELAPQDNITRAATVTILDRAISTYADKAGATVKADGKGLVLVVAENVKITGAPEGTKIVVADGATGLTVNGKAVSDDQTYIVPKTTTGSSSSSSGGHSHSYTSTVTKEPTCTEKGEKTFTCTRDGSTYTEEIPALGHALGNWTRDGQHLAHTRTCSRSNCSYSETENCKYTVTTANDKDTYTCPVCGDTYEVEKNSAVRIGTTGYANLDTALAADGENNTIVLLKDLDVTAQINVTKSVTIEGAGHTIKANNTNGWATDNSIKHLLNIQDTTSNVIIKNLTLDSNNQAYGNQAYSATGVAFNDVTMVNSKGAGLTVNRSTVTANNLTTSNNTWGGVNVDPKADNGTLHFTLTGSSSLGEPTQIWAEKVNGPAVVTADGYYCRLDTNNDGKEFYYWNNTLSDNAAAKVEVGGVDVYHTSLEKALSETTGTVEITLVKGKTATVPAITDRMVTLVGEDKEASIIDMTKSGIIGAQNANLKLTIKNATVKFDDKAIYKGITHSKKVVYEGCIIEGKQFLYAESVEFKSCKLKNSNDYCLWTYGSANVLFDTCTFNTGGKAIFIYNEKTNEGFTAAVTVNNCIFNDDDTLKEDNGTDDLLKAAIETGSNGGNTETSNKYTIMVNNATVNGFAVNTTGTNTGSKLWANKNSMDAEHLTVIIDGKLASKASGATLQEIINSKPESPVEITLAENETVELKNVDVPEGYILYKKDTDDSKTYQLMKNEGNVEVSLQELQNLKITQGPKAADAKATTFTVGLVDQKIKAGDISYSEHNSGYTGKGVQIGSSSLNSYAAEPAKAGNYEFVIKGGTINSAVTGYESIDGLTNTSVYMLVPGNSDVVFEGVTFNGVFSFDVQMYTSPWSYLNSITFKNCTFNGIIVGSCPAKEATFEGCVFNSYTNTTKANNSNPIWWRAATGYWGEGSDESVHSLEKFTFVGNRVFGTRPVKIERIGWNCTASITILNNYFDISAQANDTETKNMAINIGQRDNTSKFILIDDDNRISNNTASLYTAALGSGSNQYIAVTGTQVQDSKDNDKVIKVMVWKTTTGETFEMKTIQ